MPRGAWACGTGDYTIQVIGSLGHATVNVWFPAWDYYTLRHVSHLTGPARELAEALLVGDVLASRKRSKQRKTNRRSK